MNLRCILLETYRIDNNGKNGISSACMIPTLRLLNGLQSIFTIPYSSAIYIYSTLYLHFYALNQTRRNPFHFESSACCRMNGSTWIYISITISAPGQHMRRSQRSLIKTMTKVSTKLLPLASFNQIDTRRYKRVHDVPFICIACICTPQSDIPSEPAARQRKHNKSTERNYNYVFCLRFCHCRRKTDIRPNCLFLISSS